MSTSSVASRLPATLLDLTVDLQLLPRPLALHAAAARPLYAPTSRQSNHSAFSPQGSGGFSPALLPLRRTRTASAKLVAVKSPPQLASPRDARPSLISSRGDALAQWAVCYAGGSP